MNGAARLRVIARNSRPGPGLLPDLVELGFVLILCTGVGFVFWPAALVLFGLLGVVACERRSVSVQAGSRPVNGRSERVA